MSEQFSDVEITIASDIAWKIIGKESPIREVVPSLVREFLTIRNAVLFNDLRDVEYLFDPAPAKEVPTPAVPPKKSVFPDYIICLEDGKKVKMLKAHIRRAFGMTPADYREKWGLPAEYPMTAPNYAAKRAEIAKKSGLGKR